MQHVTANGNRESAESVDLIVSRLVKPEFVRADLPVILALQETRSRNTDELHVPVHGDEFGLTSLPDSGLLEQRTEIVAIGKMYIRFRRVLDGHECACSRLGTGPRGVREIHGGGDKDFRDGQRESGQKLPFCAGDFNIELLLLCIGEETDEELDDFYGDVVTVL